MVTTRSTFIIVALAVVTALAASVAITRQTTPALDANPTKAGSSIPAQWTAAAPGRVEPRRGEVRLAASQPGRIVEIPIALNDRVVAGEMLIRFDDEDAKARVAAAEAEAQVRRRERDAETTNNRLALDRRQAEDAVAASERAVASARIELDRVQRAKRGGTAGSDEALDSAQKALTAAQERLETDRAVLRRAQTAANVPLPTRLEAGLTAARADLSLAEAALERTRLRAPSAGTVLQLLARVGETASASPEQTLVVIGDLGQMRVRSELEERDVSKVKPGQAAVVRSDAYPGRDFTGKIAVIARTLAPAKLAQRGPRRPTDLDSLEILVDLDAAPELLPGMRVDVYFKADPPPPPAAAPKQAEPQPAPASGGTSAKGAATK